MARGAFALVVLLWGTVFSAAPVEGHGAPHPVQLWRRVSHDCYDDWSGHGAGADGHDLIAFDVAERYFPSAGEPLVVFRLLLAGGQVADASRPTLKLTITAVSPTKTFQAALQTADNRTFSAPGAPTPAYIGGPTSAGDGSRFWLEAGYHYLDLGAQPGQELKDFSVQGWVGERRADFMPGGYSTYDDAGAETRVTQCPLNQTAEETWFSGIHRLQGTAEPYFGLESETATARGAPGADITRQLTLRNRLDSAQQVLVRTEAPAGWSHRADPSDFSLGVLAERSVVLHLVPTADASDGSIRVTVTSDHGAFHAYAIPIDLANGTAPAGSTGAPAPMPGLAVLLTAVTLSVAFILGRRRA